MYKTNIFLHIYNNLFYTYKCIKKLLVYSILFIFHTSISSCENIDDNPEVGTVQNSMKYRGNIEQEQKHKNDTYLNSVTNNKKRISKKLNNKKKISNKSGNIYSNKSDNHHKKKVIKESGNLDYKKNKSPDNKLKKANNSNYNKANKSITDGIYLKAKKTTKGFIDIAIYSVKNPRKTSIKIIDWIKKNPKEATVHFSCYTLGITLAIIHPPYVLYFILLSRLPSIAIFAKKTIIKIKNYINNKHLGIR